MHLPLNREELRQRWESGERFEFYLFYGHKPPETGVDASCLSQWFVGGFEIDGIHYLTAEHWMMAEKARLFGDDEMLAQILASPGPREAKALGRKVKNFDVATWRHHNFDIVKRGNLAKFSQNEDLGAFLQSTASFRSTNLRAVAEEQEEYLTETEAHAEEVRERLTNYQFANRDISTPTGQSNVILVEAAGRDTIWGIGLGQNNPKALNPFTWRGLNLLGFVLTAVREELTHQD